MSTEAAFLAAILDDPDDDAPRLIYADWLDEQGQGERAEFIRVQCKIEQRRRGPAGPVSDESPWLQNDSVYQALRRRERELLSATGIANAPIEPQAGIEWAGPPFVALPWDDARWEWRRGFVHSLTCRAADWLTHADTILAAHPIEQVTLTTWPEMHPDDMEDYFRGSIRAGYFVTKRLYSRWWRIKKWTLPQAEPIYR